MSEAPKPVAVKILDKDYKVACPPGEHEALVSAAKEVDRRMREIRKSGKVLSADRIAVMVALNMAHELITTKAQMGNIDEGVVDRLDVLQSRIADTLSKCHSSNHLDAG